MRPTFRPPKLQPTDEQLRIQMDESPLAIVVANAGAAKTTTLALRIAQVLHEGAMPNTIMALTYSEPAIEALRTALKKMGLEEAQITGLRISTFESFASRMLAWMEGHRPKRYTDPEGVRPHVLAALRRASESTTEFGEPSGEALTLHGTGSLMVEGLLREFSLLKGTLRLLDLPEGRLTRHVAEDFGLNFDTLKIFRAYEYLRTQNGDEPGDVAFRYREDGCFDLAMRVAEGNVFRDDRPALCLNLSLLLVDEMHDMNRAMFRILCALLQANPHCHFVGVGDPDQVIHNTNGADSAFMGEEFRIGLGAPMRFSLTQTFRFGQKLADLLGTSYDKPYRCYQPYADRTQVEHYQAGDPSSDPARFCAAKISDELHLHPSASIAVLIRDRYQSIDVERLLLDRGLRYSTHGLDPYWTRPETLLVRILFAHSQTEYAYANIPEKTRLAMVRTLIECTGRSPEDLQLSLSGIEKTCSNDLGGGQGNNRGLDSRIREVVDLILREAPNTIRSHLMAARDCLAAEDQAEFKRHFAKHLAPHKLSELIFVQQQDRDLFCQGISALVRSISERETGLSNFFQSVNQQEAYWSQADRAASKTRLRVSSIEAAKGLEFETVFLYGFDTQPLGQKIIAASNTKNPLYVGATRAQRQLFLVDTPAAAPIGRIVTIREQAG